MNKLQIAKTAVSYMTGYSVGVATASFLNTHRNHSDNKALELVIDGSTVVTAYAIGSMVQERVHAFTDAKIDSVVRSFNEMFRN